MTHAHDHREDREHPADWRFAAEIASLLTLMSVALVVFAVIVQAAGR